MTFLANPASRNLQQLIDLNCSQEELGRICAGLGIDFERLPGPTKSAKLVNLINLQDRDGRLAVFIRRLREQRPDVAWPDAQSRNPASSASSNGKQAPAVRKSALQNKLEDVKGAILKLQLRDQATTSDQRQIGTALVQAALGSLDPPRKRLLLEFLYSEGLLRKGETIIHLQNCPLRGVDLSWIDLTDADLRGADFYQADFSLAKMRAVDLSGAQLRGAKLRAYLANADLIRADLREAELSAARLNKANLAGANLRVADLHEADLSEANLTGADLTLANLQGANLRQAILTQARLHQANLDGADITGAIFDHTDR